MKTKYKEYLVDFGTMGVIAKSEGDAYDKAILRMKEGEMPKIDTVIDNGEYDLMEGEEIS